MTCSDACTRHHQNTSGGSLTRALPDRLASSFTRVANWRRLKCEAADSRILRSEHVRMSREAIFEASLGYFLTPVKKYLDDATITEIMVNGFNDVYIERRGKLEHTDARFPS